MSDAASTLIMTPQSDGADSVSAKDSVAGKRGMSNSVTEVASAPETTGSPVVAELDEMALDEVRRRRVFAYFDDLLLITLIYATLMLVLGVTGIVPPGRPWLYAPPLYPVITIVYNAITTTRSRIGTPGMRMVGLKMHLKDGRPAPFLNVAAHALFFYLSVILLTPLILLVGTRSPQKRFLHDRLAEVYISNQKKADD